MSTIKSTLLVATALSIAAVSANVALADAERNPLHPRHYWSKAAAQPIATGNTVNYVASANNPRHPGFGIKADATPPRFVGAAEHIVKISNPLHPQYQR